jgi:hypothetical protein
MKSEKATIQPRFRRRSAQRGQALAEPLDDPRTRVLISVPWVKSTSEAKPKQAALRPSEPADAPFTAMPANPPAKSSDAALPSTPVVPPLPALPKVETRSYARIDAAHAVVPPPHTAAPAWAERPERWLNKLVRQPTIWVTAIASVVVVAVLLMRGGHDTAKSPEAAPAANFGKRELKDRADETPTNSANNKRRAARMARLADGPPTNDTPAAQNLSAGPFIADPSSNIDVNSGLTRRAAANTAGSLEDMPDWQSSPTTDSSPDENARASSLPKYFQLDDLPSNSPPTSAAPDASPSSSPSHRDERGAWLQGTVENIPYRR